MLRSACLLVLAVCLSAAPVQQASQDKALVRTKRDHPDVNPAESVEKKFSADEAKTLDKKAQVEVGTAPAENKEGTPDVAEEPPAEPPAGGQQGGQEGSREETVDKIFDEDEDNKVEAEAPTNENILNEDQAEKEAIVDRIMSEDSEPTQEASSPLEGAAYRQYLRSYIRKYLPYINAALRRKRSLLKRPQAVTAEQMGQAKEKGNLRRKRDLDVTPEELEYLLEAERDMEADEAARQEGQEPEVSEPVEYGPEEEYGPDNQALADAELLEYLYKNSPEAAEEAAYNYLPPSDVSESWEDYLPDDNADDIQYEPIVYDGQPGLFIPLAQKVQKRQLLSLVPGSRRKRGNFYPADDSLAGRWGAFIADQRAIKRADAYERLYRLARALRPDPYYEEYKKK